MINFGITGGICCGKSTVVQILKAHHFPIVDADVIARQVVEPGTVGLQSLVQEFGQGILQSDGYLNRAKIAEMVFFEPDLSARKLNMDRLKSIMTPLIHEEGAKQLAQFHQDGYGMVGWDASLIVEMGNIDEYHPLIVVHCAPELQLARLMKRNHLTVERAQAIIDSQLPSSEKIKHADYTIDTSGTKEDTVKQTEEIIKKLPSWLPFSKFLF